MNNPYSYADTQIELLTKEINAQFLNQQNLAPFDELNVVRVKADTKKLFEKLKLYHQILCERVAERAYSDALFLTRTLGYAEPKKRPKMHRTTALVAALFLLYSPVTKYQYRNETERKRERLADGILSAKHRQDVRDVYNTGAKVWFNQARQYIDMSVDTAREAAFEDAGVTDVKWVAQKDGKVCKECRERDGMIYRIGQVPDKPHPRCRCYIVPVSRDEQVT